MLLPRQRKSASVWSPTGGREPGDARDIAISASNEFGVPLLDLDAVALDRMPFVR